MELFHKKSMNKDIDIINNDFRVLYFHLKLKDVTIIENIFACRSRQSNQSIDWNVTEYAL